MNKDFRQKSDQELITIVEKLRIQLLEYRFRNATGEFEKVHQIKIARRSLAQALTILRERNVDISHLQLRKLSDIQKDSKHVFKSQKDTNKENTSEVKK